MGRFDYTADDDTHQELERIGRKLLSPLKGKDNLLKLLKGAGESLAEAAQNSEAAKLAARDLAKALGRPEFLRHKDKEVQLYTAFSICHILRLNAPDTPYTDEQLQLIFDLFNRAYAELEDSASPHFQLCMSILETVAKVKCSLLILDLPEGTELVCSLFNTLLDAINRDNAEALEGTMLELLRGMIEEADDLPQPQLDALLSRLLPSAAAQAPAAHALVAALLQRTETTVQPYLQRFLKALLTGSRTDTELRDNAYELFYAVHETVPQALLPLEPQLRAELEEETDAGKRQAAVELAARLLAARPGGGARLLDEYEPLLGALLSRGTDADATVRRKVLEAAGDLMEACAGRPQQQAEVLRAAAGRLHDPDDAVRRAAVAAVCRLLQLHPALARSTNTDGRGPVLSLAYQRLRDKKLSVRREAASQLAALLRAWTAAAQEDPAAAPEPRVMLSLPLVVCNCAVRDPELGAHVFDTVWRAGMFSAKLAPAAVARYWAQMWFQAGDDNRPMLVQTLMGKVHMQQHVQRLISLRAAVKEQRTASMAGAASSAGAGATSASTHGGGGGGGGQYGPANPEAQLQSCTAELLAALRDVSKPEEGLQKLLEAKDNHIFRGLSTLATPGCTYAEAAAAAKDVLQRVGSKGPAADLARVLVARMTPNLLPPEALHAAMEEAEQSDDAQRFLVEVAGEAPLLLAQSLDRVAAMFESEDPAVCECAAKILSRAGQGMARHRHRAKQEVPAQLVERLRSMCGEGGPAAVKAAVKALVVLLPRAEAEGQAGELADQLLARLKDPATLRHHGRLLAALKGLSMVGRLLPGVFEPRADEVLDFVVGDLLEADLSSGKPLPGVEAAPAAAAGRVWRRPSAVVAVKTAALRTLCQALVPDNPKAQVSQAMVERATLVWELLEPLMDTDEAEPQFHPFQLVFPKVSDPEHAELRREARAKRRRVSGGASEEEEGDDEGYLECMDGAWVRFSAVCGLLRLARAYDAAMPAPLYANLALTFQEPLVEPRRDMTLKLHGMVALLAGKREPALAQRAAKYAAILALFAVDPEEHNQGLALRTLRDYVLQRRRVVERVAAAAAATGSGGGSLVQEMPEFLLAFLVFLLAHHPDYPTQERLEEYSQAGEEEQLEMYGDGGPFAPFMGMLQFALEALVVPAEQPTSPSEVARLLPPAIKLLRTLKVCDDACSEPRTEEAHQLCDLGLMLLKQIADRLTSGKALEPARFPGQIVLPRLCYKYNAAHQRKRADGSDLPPARYFSPGLYAGDLFLRRLLIPRLPGPVTRARKGRSKPSSQRRGASGRGADGAGQEDDLAAGTARSLDEDASVGHSARSGVSDGEEEGQQHSAGKRKAPAKQQRQRGGGKRSRARQEGGAGSGEAEVTAAARRHSGSKPAETPTRQQPRRGAKSDAAGKLKDASDADEEDEEEGSSEVDEQPAQRQKRGSGPMAAAVTRRQGAEHSVGRSPGDALLGSPDGGSGRAAAGAGAAAARELRAGTDDEEAPTPSSARPPPSRKRQQRQDEETSPGQENRSAGNGAVARRGGQGKAKQAPQAATKSAQAASTPKPFNQGVQSRLRRTRA